jgi:acetolactate synthase-1/2/3 large subunit
MTVNGKGALSDRHPLAFPAVATAALTRDADVILAAGTRFVAGAAPVWDRQRTKVIQLDIDPEEAGRNYPPDVTVIADARAGLEALSTSLGARGSAEARREALARLKQHYTDHAQSLQPQAGLALAIREALPDDAILFSESTQVGYWSHQYWPAYAPRTYFTSGYQGTLGYGYATALGAQVGNPDKVVVSINGDGGFFYNVQELSTMAQHNIPMITIVFNDNAYGNVKRIQQEQFGGRTIASDLHNPDMLKLADAYSIKGLRATTPDELRRAVADAVAVREPVLIEVPVGPMPRLTRPPDLTP